MQGCMMVLSMVCNAMQLDNKQEAQQDSGASKSQTGGKCLALSVLGMECR